ncbi:MULTISPECIES: hypothetical protein [Parafrankia]|uniref:hypothetical protein n=1 Tax=Parafrankia TaxID=2994362 RepID=UPI000A92192D|nr:MULTISPECIES: hypothetical protein [Parafrankia]MBE3203289.1 hypothetical protein [Parafrankia sp. CH37]
MRFDGGAATELAVLWTTSENGLCTVTAAVPAGATNAQFLLRYGSNNCSGPWTTSGPRRPPRRRYRARL